MEIHQLRYFVEVVRLGNFTRAAERCHVTQPTLSHQIKKLEEELNEPLLQRRKRGTAPTSFGEKFYDRAVRILREVEEAKSEAESYSAEVRGCLKLGAIPTVAPYRLSRLIEVSAKVFPHLRFEITEEPTNVLLKLLRRGELDLALVSPPILGDEWAFQKLCDDELLATVPDGHGLAKEKSISLKMLLEHPLVLMNETHCLRGQALQLCHQTRIEPEVRIGSSQLDTVMALVEAGMGLTLTPKMAVPYICGRRVAFRSLGPKPQFRAISFAWPKQASNTHALRSFLALAGGISWD